MSSPENGSLTALKERALKEAVKRESICQRGFGGHCKKCFSHFSYCQADDPLSLATWYLLTKSQFP